jgi:hypothetical protein
MAIEGSDAVAEVELKRAASLEAPREQGVQSRAASEMTSGGSRAGTAGTTSCRRGR